IQLLPVKANLPIGVFDDTNYVLQEAQLPTDTTIFLYTDGLTEAKNRQRKCFKMERVLDALKDCKDLTSNQLSETIKTAVNQFVDGAEQSDDLTLLTIRYQRPTDSNTI
ncbi:MAG: serine/threonine-protein phosphatase, partial [Prevotella sp.]|nr:serine/threonine-protein phosphatase [Prevotella sp.]